MPLIRNHFTKQSYTKIHNRVIEDSNLSFKALGLYLYLRSKPNDWRFTEDTIAKQHKDGVTSVRSAIKELEHAGYLKREYKYTEVKGREVIYNIYEISSLENLT